MPEAPKQDTSNPLPDADTVKPVTHAPLPIDGPGTPAPMSSMEPHGSVAVPGQGVKVPGAPSPKETDDDKVKQAAVEKRAAETGSLNTEDGAGANGAQVAATGTQTPATKEFEGITARMRVSAVTAYHNGETVTMRAIGPQPSKGAVEGVEPGNNYASGNPFGDMSFTISNPEMFGKHAVGDLFNVDFYKAGTTDPLKYVAPTEPAKPE